MGMFDKIKNLFYEEEIVEIPKEKIKDEVKVNLDSDEQKKDDMDDIISERDLVKSETNFKFPIIFEEEDFVEVKKEDKKPEMPKTRESYSRVSVDPQPKYRKPTLDREVIREVIEKPKKFSPSPVISPVYGILDKNYKKDEVSKSKNSLEQTKELVINFDTIRQKAYGSLSEDIERELSTKEDKIDEIEKEIDNILEENNLLTDLEEDIPESIEVKKIEVEPEEEYNYSDFGVEYKISEEPKPDPKPKKTKVKDSVSLDDSLDKDDKKEQEENKDKQVELTEDLFNLIDSMYDR